MLNSVNIKFILPSLLLLISCSNEMTEEECAIIDDNYSAELLSKLSNQTNFLRQELSYSYSQYDIAQHKYDNGLYNKVERDSFVLCDINSLHESSIDLKKFVDINLIFPFNNSTEVDDRITYYSEFIINTLDNFEYPSEYDAIEQINERFDSINIEELELMSENEFLIEIELIKQLIIQIEHLSLELLLLELE